MFYRCSSCGLVYFFEEWGYRCGRCSTGALVPIKITARTEEVSDSGREQYETTIKTESKSES